jgi:hypothetical protein
MISTHSKTTYFIMKNFFVVLPLWLLAWCSALAQSTEIRPGIILPQMTTSQREGMTNAINGMLVFDTGTQSYWFRQNGNWVNLASAGTASGNAWNLSGNMNTDTSTNFLGTTDKKSLFLRINNKPYGRLGTNGNIAIGQGTLGKAFTDDGFGNVQNMTDAIAIGDSAMANVFLFLYLFWHKTVQYSHRNKGFTAESTQSEQQYSHWF